MPVTADVLSAVGVLGREKVKCVGNACCGLWWADFAHRTPMVFACPMCFCISCPRPECLDEDCRISMWEQSSLGS